MEKIDKLIKQFESLGIDGLMVTGEGNRRYLSGFTGSNGVILITRNEKKLITDYRYFEQAKAQTDFDIVLHAEHTGHKEKIFDEVAKQVNGMKITRLGFEQQHLSHLFYSKVSGLVTSELVPTFEFVEDLRMIKSKEEIEKIKVASEIADQAYLHILKFLRPGITEIAVQEEIKSFIQKNGGAPTMPSLTVASGVRSSLPHGRASEKTIEKGDMIQFDYGALYEGYYSDMARTVAIGEPAEQLKEIQQIVLTSLKNCTGNIKAGLTDTEVDKLMRDHIKECGYNDKSGTGTGHGIGLELHEKPLFSVQHDKELKSGMVVTVEPGIYIPELGGARVEDLILIKDDGCEIFTPSSKELVII